MPDTKNPHTGQGAGASVSSAADALSYTQNATEQQCLETANG